MKTIAPRCCGRPDAQSPEAARPRAIVHQVVHSTEGAIVFTVAPKKFVIVVFLPNPGGVLFLHCTYRSAEEKALFSRSKILKRELSRRKLRKISRKCAQTIFSPRNFLREGFSAKFRANTLRKLGVIYKTLTV